ncbi:putative glutamate carboxypeptidase [Arachis hypogaea]|nr:putative glutamate carboxypeptidase [Arachis hypogaea]
MSIQEFASAAKQVDDESKLLRLQETAGDIVDMKKRALNDRIILAEKGFLDADGLHGSILRGLELLRIISNRNASPHIAIGALAASAPILQFEDIVPLETFYDIISSDFKVGQTRNGLVQLSTLATSVVCKRIDGQSAGTSVLEHIYEGVNVYYNYTGETVLS